MLDVALDAARVLLAGLLVIGLLVIGHRENLLGQSGWRCIVAGFMVFSLAAFLDTQNQRYDLGGYGIDADGYKALLLVGWVASFLLLGFGFWRWAAARRNSPPPAPADASPTDEAHRQLTVLRQRIQQLHQELRQSESAEQQAHDEKEHLQSILHSVGEAIITTDHDGTVQYLNPMAENLTGWTNGEARGRALGEVFHIVGETDREPLPDPVARCLREGSALAMTNPTLLINRLGHEYVIQDSAAPIHNLAGELLGAVVLFHDVTEARRIERQMTHQATHDDLTGLINRREFERRLRDAVQTARAEHTEHALCYLDLDQFKVINDTCGHMAGDELLRQIARLLRSKVRKLDTLARLGGDEFAVLMESCSLDQAKRVANALREAVQNFRFMWDGKRFGVGVSIGLVPVSKTSESVTGILKAADSACYTAKEKGRNRVHVVYREDDTELVKRRGEMQWVFLIPWALEENRFQLNFQPIVPLHGGTDPGDHYELLIRLLDDQGTVVSPGTFLLPAERYNLAPKLDRWVVQAAFSWYARQPEHLARLFLCEINLSGQSLGDEQFLQFVIAKFKEGQVPPEKICFEITETAAIANLDSATRFIGALKDLGCRFALDDFGSGLSSFAYLRNLAVDLLKIDGQFVKNIVNDPIDLALVKSINDIGKVMGLKTIAEFVESDEILVKLRELGVDYAQGYAVGQPQPLTELRAARAALAP